MILVLSIGLISCKNEEEPKAPQEVQVTLDFDFFKSGSMSRSSEDVYANFYETQLKTKKVCPKNYSLVFERGNTIVMESKGTWGINNTISLLEATYKVTGNSNPMATNGNSISFGCDSVYMAFDEQISVTSASPNITLQAKYNCALILVPDADVEELKIEAYSSSWSDGTSGFKTLKTGHSHGVYYFFYNTNYYNSSVRMICRTSASTTNLVLSDLKLQMGKYYVLNTNTSSFDMPNMEPGK